MAIIKAISSHAPIKTVLDYVTKNEKVESRLISGVGCSPETVKDEMQATKELYGKTDGRTYKHFVQSFAPGEEITPQKAHEIAMKLVHETSFLSGYEVLIATHEDKKHIHSHFVVNSVSYENGRKFHMSSRDLQELKDYSDNLCRENGLSICEKGKSFDGSLRQSVVAWVKEKYQCLKSATNETGKSYMCDIKSAIETAMDKATSIDEYKKILSEKGVAINWKDSRKYITYIDSNGKKVRDTNLKKTFNLDADKESLLKKFEENRENALEIETGKVSKDYLVAQYKADFYTEIQDLLGRKIDGQKGMLDNVNAKIRQADDSIRKIRADIEKWTQQKSECTKFQIKQRYEFQGKIDHGNLLVASIQENKEEYLSQLGISSSEEIGKIEDDLREAEKLFEEIGEQKKLEEHTLESMQVDNSRFLIDISTVEDARDELKSTFVDDFSEEMFQSIVENAGSYSGNEEEVISLDEGKSRS